MTNELTPNEVDQMRYQPEKKPLREFIDNKVIPNAGAAVGLPIAAVTALSNIKRNPSFINI